MRTRLSSLILFSMVVGSAAFTPKSLIGVNTNMHKHLDSLHGRYSVVKATKMDVEDETTSTSQAAYSGAGPVLVDMNMYNLPIERIVEEWTANVVAQSSMTAEGIYLGAKTKEEIMIDTLKIEGIKRREGQGLGIELLELAGGREDGLGITIVSGLVESGICEKSDIKPGDSISKIAVLEANGEEIAAISTECLGYDATVDAIVGLPPPANGQTLSLTVKRLRTRPKVQISLEYPPSQGEPNVTFELFSGENLRRALLVRGIKLNDPLSRRFDSGGTGDCGAEGTCATCVVNIVEGSELLNEAGVQEKQILVKNPRWRMACKTVVGHGMKSGDLKLRVNPRQWDD